MIYLFIGVPQKNRFKIFKNWIDGSEEPRVLNCSTIQENDDIICEIEEFDELNSERMRSLQKQISKHKTYKV